MLGDPLQCGMQPQPLVNDHQPIVDVILLDPRVSGSLRKEFEARKQLGAERYGTPLQPFNGRDALRDAFDEVLDLCIYLMQVVKESEEGSVEFFNFTYQYNCALSIAESISFASRGKRRS